MTTGSGIHYVVQKVSFVKSISSVKLIDIKVILRDKIDVIICVLNYFSCSESSVCIVSLSTVPVAARASTVTAFISAPRIHSLNKNEYRNERTFIVVDAFYTARGSQLVEIQI